MERIWAMIVGRPFGFFFVSYLDCDILEKRGHAVKRKMEKGLYMFCGTCSGFRMPVEKMAPEDLAVP